MADSLIDLGKKTLKETLKITARPGVYVVNDATPVTDKQFTGIYIAEDTVIASLTIVGGTVNVVSDDVSTPGTAVKGGVMITCANGYFGGITLTSGSVALILQ